MSLPYLYVLTAALAAIFLLHCAVIGTALLKWFRIPSDFAVFYGLCVGMFVNMAALFGLGILGWFTLGAVLAKLASLLMAGVAVHWIASRGAGVRLARRAGAGAEVVAVAGAGSDGARAAPPPRCEDARHQPRREDASHHKNRNCCSRGPVLSDSECCATPSRPLGRHHVPIAAGPLL